MSAPIVVILAAGQGTRMRSATPKPLHELCGQPLVMWPVRAALEARAQRVVVVDSPARALAPVLPEGVHVAVQQRSDGTGGAARAALAELQRAGALPDAAPVVVLAGDVPLLDAATIAELVQAHQHSHAVATVATTVLAHPAGYGRVVRNADRSVERIVETKAPGDATPEELQIGEVNTGAYVFTARALADVLPQLTAHNAQGELYLPQALQLLRARGQRIAAHTVADPQLVLGVNDRADLARVRALAQHAIHRRHMLAGVTIVDPASTVIDVHVQIGPDTLIEPFSSLRGATRVGAHCTIRCSYLLDCVLEDHVSVGPFAYMRRHAVAHAHAKIGTFVEIKNSHIGQRAKVPHLSYIGDAHVGPHTNLGASTITANYDGRAKHRTTIGSHVHTGVHTSLVAPVHVGDHASTGAGSVIVQPVPPGALGIARQRQTNVEGYAQRRHGDGDGEAEGEPS